MTQIVQLHKVSCDKVVKDLSIITAHVSTNQLLAKNVSRNTFKVGPVKAKIAGNCD